MNTLVTDHLWQQLNDLSRKSAAKHAAVAYVTCDKYVRFGQGDTLVVDAADSTVQLGQTNALVLDRAFKRGARLYSLPHLHSKIMVFDRTVIIGSANISVSSAETLVEAAWITDHPTAAPIARRFIETVTEQADEVDEDFLERLKAIEVTPAD
jgi:phosphatidylserine/phosphatidylglycerophosphate/cardiolipin synthase-like enzyme